MLARAFVGGAFFVLLALAAFEMRVLWPLATEAPKEFTLRELGRINLGVEGQQTRLTGVAVSSNGTVWVADAGRGLVIALSEDGDVLGQYPAKDPAGIAADGDGVVTIDPTTAAAQRIEVGPGVTETWNLGSFNLYVPRGIARRDGGALVVAATGSGFVLVVDDALQQPRRLGVTEEGRSLLLDPEYPLVDAQGRVYVSDRKGGVLRWSGSEEPDVVFRTRSREAAVLSHPRQSALDPSGRLWVADDEAGRVWVFDDDGGLIGTWRPPTTPFPHPLGLAIGGGRVYVTDRDTSELFWFELPPHQSAGDLLAAGRSTGIT